MRFRFLAMGALAGVLALLSLVSVPVAGQGASGVKTGSGAALRTPWGAPDLNGIWNNQHVTPFERAKEFGAREFLTDAEIAARDAQLSGQPTRSLGRDTRKPQGTEKDVAGAYNSVWEQDRPQKSGRRTSSVIDPPDGRLPPTLPAVLKRNAEEREYLQALLQGSSGGRPGPVSPRKNEPPPYYNMDRMNRADGPEDRATSERCIGNGLPAMGAMQRLVQSPDSVEIFYDIGQGSGFSRVIPISNMPHLPSNIRQFWGDARGHWEGDTLVVDVTNFTNRTDFRGSRENLHLIERYSRTAADTLTYQVTVEDPTVWPRSWTAVAELTKNDEKTNLIFDQTCHEGNYGLLGMLSNTRAAEKLFKEGKGPDPALQDLATGGGGGDGGGRGGAGGGNGRFGGGGAAGPE